MPVALSGSYPCSPHRGHCIPFWAVVSALPAASTFALAPWVLGKQTVCCFHYQFHYVPTRSAYVPTRSAVAFDMICGYSIRSYTFWATLTQFQKKMYSNHTFLYVLCNPPTNSEKYVLKSYVPIRSEQPSRSSCLISYVPSRSDYVPSRSTDEFEKKKHIVSLTFLHVPCNSIAKVCRRWKTRNAYSTVSQKHAGGIKAGTHMELGRL